MLCSRVWMLLFDGRSLPSDEKREERGGIDGILIEGEDFLNYPKVSIFGVWGVKDEKEDEFFIRSLLIESNGDDDKEWTPEEKTLQILREHHMPSFYTL